jgi:2-iminobutanoate/2-iminopropanoate deaminase
MSDEARYEVKTDDAPAALGPYNQGVCLAASGLVFVSGQIGTDPATGELASGGVKGQTEQCIKNMLAIVRAAGGDEKSIAKTTVYLASIEDFPAMNEVYSRMLGSPYPARSCLGGCNLPRGALVEIEAVAASGATTMRDVGPR